jgi:hypothetical protein
MDASKKWFFASYFIFVRSDKLGWAKFNCGNNPDKNKGRHQCNLSNHEWQLRLCRRSTLSAATFTLCTTRTNTFRQSAAIAETTATLIFSIATQYSSIEIGRRSCEPFNRCAIVAYSLGLSPARP